MFFWNALAFYMIQYVGNLISGSFAFSKTSLNIWKFTVHVLLKHQFAFQSQRKAMPKNAQTTAQIALISHASDA